VKLALGTVQFGIDYGVSNKNGKVSINEVGEILECAKSQGIYTIDTASLYGTSEEVLGQFDLDDFDVITKTIKIDKTLDRYQNFERFREAFFTSQKKLGYIQLHGLMFHEASDLLSDSGFALWDLVDDFKQKEYVRKIGVSVYSPEQLDEILKMVDIDIVQLPLNMLDQRFLPMLPELKKKNIEIHTRSTFLQGLLLMETCQLNPYFEPIKDILKNLPPNRLDASLAFVKNIKEVDKIVVGVTNRLELEQLCLSYTQSITGIDFSKFKIEDEKFINPSNWRI
jgi:aryl-alcohol dehydrogenase-like predicted oxidoreductase